MTRKGIIVSLLIAVLVGVVLIGFSRLFNAEQDGISASISNSGSGKPPTMMPLNEKPRSLKPISFANAEGDDLDLSHWRGKFVLLNIWATWCAPCREEMPTLDNLQQQLGGPEFEVVALSIDRAGVGVVEKFYKKIGIKHLSIYVDQTMKASTDLGAYGLPTTLLISPEGLELGRLAGPATWDSAETISFLRALITQKSKEN
ncbi:TlpA disulfide reductase family protein [uncultured Sneathiella sp.]|jgi:thiol-disulfide isomerase/thioredoxin|uniref:TlpA family protein disulfide reductase n=1 Tax=uncultured Sneathiella sp. TaxID=879315 RepID=UPI0030D717E3|tara:strand:- start:22728 stop:23333 length:606 start_codon:yes stop_codon:yes gene_type:complete